MQPALTHPITSSWTPVLETSVHGTAVLVAGNREDVEYNFTSYAKLVAHFSQWLPESYLLAAIENEKLVFVVRREVSLEETRLQFLKKCEILLEQVMSENQNSRLQDWGYGIQS